MKIVLRILLGLVILIVLVVGVALAYVLNFKPDVGKAPDISIEVTPERVARGKYLANSVTVCMDCHATRKWDLFSGPMDTTKIGVGGEIFDQSQGFPGTFVSKNITPFNLKNWTDGEIYRAVTEGVDKDGKALFPIMPYLAYGKMDKEDIYSIIAYLRTLKPIESTSKVERKIDGAMNVIIHLIPQKADHQKMPDTNDRVAYGKYLVGAASCVECHTQATDKGDLIMDKAYGGGRVFVMPPGDTLRSANISPDVTTGIGAWTEDDFVKRFKSITDSSYVLPKVKPGDFQTIMPWTMFATMKESDLRAIYRYLHSITPISNRVEHFTKAK